MKVIEVNEQAFFRKYGVSIKGLIEKKTGTVWENGSIDNTISQQRIAIPEETLLLICFGIGDSSYIEKILYEKNNMEVTTFVPEGEFLYLCCNKDISHLINNKRFEVVLCGPETNYNSVIKERITFANYKYTCIMKQVDQRGENNLFNKIEHKILEYIEEVRITNNTYIHFGEKMCVNELYAFSRLSKSFLAEEMFNNIPTRDIPVVIVSAGPSLDKNVIELKKCKNSAIVIAVDHATPLLDKYSIVPDLVGRIDPNEQYFFSKHDKEKKYRMLISAKGTRHIQQIYQGRCIYYDFNTEVFGTERIQKNEKDIDFGGSVATSIFSLFLEAGFKTFILTGQDLAYGKGKTTHAGKEKEMKNDPVVFVDGYFGEKVESRPDWVTYLNYYEKKIGENPHITVINATEGGALIKGAKNMDLAQAIALYCNKAFPIESWLENISGGNDEDKIESLELLKRYRIRSIRAEGELKEILSLNNTITESIKNQRLNEKYFKNCNNYDSLYHKLLEDDDMKLLHYYCNAAVQAYVTEALELENQKDVIRKMESEKKLFSEMLIGEEQLVGYLDSLLADMYLGE